MDAEKSNQRKRRSKHLTEVSKDVQKLTERKSRAQRDGDMKLFAETSKDLGDIQFQAGEYSEALEHYKDQVRACEILADSLNEAVGNRMIGEVLTSMNRPEEALRYQNLYLEGAKKSDDLIEQQRAYATLGRTQFCLSQTLECGAKRREALQAAKKAYVRSLEICDQLERNRAKIEKREMMIMRARLLLNLGLILEAKDQPNKGINLVEKAACLCEQNNLKEDLHRSYISLGGLHERAGTHDEAREYYQRAAKTDDVALKEEARLSEAELLIKLGNWSEARKLLVQLYVHHKSSQSIQEAVSRLLKIAAVMQDSEEKLKVEDNNEKRLQIYENMGDAASEGKCFEKAIDCYQNMLACAEIGEIENKIAAALVSLAQTLKDNKQYEEALIYAKKELELCNDPKEICRSSLFLSELLILTHSPESQILQAFQSALKNAEASGNLSLKLSVLRDMLDYYNDREDDEKVSELTEKIAELEDLVPNEESDDEENTSLNEIVIELDDLSDVEEEMQKKNGKVGRKNPPRRPEFRKNNKGEMPLQVACIQGNIQRVEQLLEQRHPVNCRDYYGWTPLHEAANHGYVEIVDLLIRHGAHVNDPGGTGCGGITPLHDAANCGHTAIINLLIQHGADPKLKSDEGLTVLDYLEAWRDRVGDLSPADEMDYHVTRNKLKLIIPKTTKQSPNGIAPPVRPPLIDPDAEEEEPPPMHPDLPEERISAAEVYRRAIADLKPNRSRLSRPKSSEKIAAPLIDSEEALIDEDEWLEDDLQIKTPKKRRSSSGNETPGSAKRKSNNLTPNEDKTIKRRKNNDPQAVEVLGDSENSRDSFNSDHSEIFTPNTSNSSRNQRKRPKQGSLLTSGFTRNVDSRTPSPLFVHRDAPGTPLRTQRSDSQRRQSDFIRVEVELDKNVIKTKLKVQEDNEKIISDLVDDVLDKFEEITGCRGKLELTTSSGDVLQAENISNIMFSSDGILKLTGRMLELQIPSIVDRFQKICDAMGVDSVDGELLRSLKACKNTGTFRLKSDEILDLELTPILRSLEYEKSLQALHLSSGNFYNLGELVNESLTRLTSLQELHLQGCDIDHIFLSKIEHLPPQLRVLDLSYNPLRPESQEDLEDLITPLQHLQTLNLRCCQLKKIPTTINASLVNLDISENILEADSMQSILEKQIVNLNISNNNNSRSSVLNAMLSDLPSTFMSLETLELTGCSMKDLDVLSLLDKCQNLGKIILADNPDVSQVSLEALLGKKPTLMLIDVTGCEKIVKMPTLELKIDNPSVCTLMATIASDVCDSWKNLWGYQAILYKQPYNIVIIRPIV